LDYKIKNMILG